jgi:hypothetical protein
MASGDYTVAVHCYSGDRPLAGCDARVTVEHGGLAEMFACPESGSGRWWQVVEIARDGRRSAPNRIVEELSPRL